MRIEMTYDKRNTASIPNAYEKIMAEFTKRAHRLFPDAEIKVKPMQANSLTARGATKQEKSQLNLMIEEMFEEADEWFGI